MTKLTIYHYDQETYEFVKTSVGRIDPRGGVLSVPAYATTVKPFITKKNQTQIFNLETRKWTIFSDFRNTEYWLSDDSYHIITRIGVEPPENASLIQPRSINLKEKIIMMDQEATAIILAKWPIHKQLNAGLGLLSNHEVEEMTNDILTIQITCATNKTLLLKLYNKGGNAAELDNFSNVWPKI